MKYNKHTYESDLERIKVASGLLGSTFDYLLLDSLYDEGYDLSDRLIFEITSYVSRATKGLVYIPESYILWLKRRIIKHFDLKRRY